MGPGWCADQGWKRIVESSSPDAVFVSTVGCWLLLCDRLAFAPFPGVLDRGKRCRHLQTDLTSSDTLLVTPSYLLHVLLYKTLLTSAVDAQNERDTQIHVCPKLSPI